MDPLTIGAIIVAGAALAGTVYSAYTQDKANEKNLDFANKQFDYQKYLNENSNQISVKDMKAAGLNPALGSISSLQTFSGSSNQQGSNIDLSPISSIASSVISSKTQEHVANIQSETQKSVADKQLETQKEIAEQQLIEQENYHNEQIRVQEENNTVNFGETHEYNRLEYNRQLDSQRDDFIRDLTELFNTRNEISRQNMISHIRRRYDLDTDEINDIIKSQRKSYPFNNPYDAAVEAWKRHRALKYRNK